MAQHSVRNRRCLAGPEPGEAVYGTRKQVASAPPRHDEPGVCAVERRGVLEGWLGTRRRPQRDLAVAATKDGLGDGLARRMRGSPAGVVMVLTAAVLAPPGNLGAQSGPESGVPPLVAAVRAGDRGAVSALLAAGADVNAAQPDGATALHWAVHREDVETAGALIRAGADVGAANDLGVTPLLMASRRGQGGLAARLLAAGRGSDRGAAERGDAADGGRPRRQPRRGRGVAGTRCAGERRGGHARPVRAHVGRRQPASGGHARTPRARGRHCGPHPHPPPRLQHGRQPLRRLGLARHRPGGGGGGRQHPASLRGPVRRLGVRPSPGGGRRRCVRHDRRRQHGARHRRAQRPRLAGGVPARGGRRSQRGPARLYPAPRRGAPGHPARPRRAERGSAGRAAAGCGRSSRTGPTRTRASGGGRRCGAGATTSPSWIAGWAPRRSGWPPTSSRWR